MDAGVLALHFISNPKVKRFFDEIDDEEKQGFVSSVNLSEFHYKTCQKLGKPVADIRYYQLRRTSLRIIETDEELSRMAGHEKCRQQKLSLADCYALGLAKRLKATLLTTDSELAKIREIRSLLFTP